MRIAVIGSSGQLGTDLLALWGDQAVGVSHAGIELARQDSVERALDELAVDVVVNAAAYNQVDEAEREPGDAMAVNALGPRFLARCCVARGSRLVHVSSDFVFGQDGQRQTPYTETDLPGPLGHYGISKLGGELFVRSLCPRHLVVRTCGLYGHASRESGRSGNFVETMLGLAEAGREIRVVDDQCCTPTSTVALAEAIAALVAAEATGVYHATCSGSVTWCEFARAVFRLAGKEVEVEAISSDEFGAAAPRPHYSVLDCGKLARETGQAMPAWDAALKDYLDARTDTTST